MTLPDPMLIYLFLSPLFCLALLRPQWAILACLAILPTYLLKLSLFGIPTTVLELSIYTTYIGSFLSILFSNGLNFVNLDLLKNWKLKIKNSKTSLLWPIAAWLIITLISALFSENIQTALGGWKAWVFDPLLVLILIIQFFDQKNIWKIVASLGLSSAVLSAYGLFEYFFSPHQLGDERLDSVFDPANYHAMLVGPIIVLLIGLIFSSQIPRIWKYLLGTASAINIIALIFTFSYGGYLAVLGGLVIYGFLTLNRDQKRKMIIGALITLIAFIIIAAPTKKFQDLFEFQERSSSHARLEIWQTSYLIFKEHPILGVGLNNFESAYRENIPRVAFPPLEWLVAQPHNLYLALLTQTGLLGFLVFIYLIVRFFQIIGVARYKLQDTRYALLSSLSAILIHGLVDTPYFKNDLSIIFWLIIALMIIHTRHIALENNQ
ncbi:hypothetical protein EPN15_03055 [Patescibacteria group bacterium]|nr:MAG: hypothetical protein EPN15_03055 [Patescibacteria group bacterium]